MPLLVGVDTGGTFTDFVLFDNETHKLVQYKYPSTPEDPPQALLNGLKTLLEQESYEPGQVASLMHGTTVATNTVLQDRLPEIGMITTLGFRDILELGRQRRPHLYNLDVEKPRPPAPLRLRLEVNERMDAEGNVQVPLDEEELHNIINRLKAADVPAVAVCFLHAYKNSSHEEMARAALHRLFPESLVSISSEVLREFREFDRFSSTAVNAALLPIMRGYLDGLDRRVRSFGVPNAPLICSSYGCNVSIQSAKEMPITTMVSGPSAGVVGAVAVAGASGFSNLVTLDMGGTSTDVCLIQEGAPLVSRQREMGGWPVTVPSVDVLSIGAGGGSILWIDEGGFLQVGPQSAGASPGPVCYNLGGDRATLTDANLVARRLNPARNLGGLLKLHPSLAEQPIREQVCEPLGFTVNAALDGIFKVLNSNLLRAVRAVSVERGYDPRECALVAFGGAGPLHATQLALEMGIGTVLVPESPGVLCALGLLMADVRGEFSQSHLLIPMYSGQNKDLNASETIENVFARLEEQASRWLRVERIDKATVSTTRTIEARYAGQGHEMAISADECVTGSQGVQKLVERFHETYEDRKGYSAKDTPVEFVHFRLQVSAPGARPKIPTRPPGDGNHSRATQGARAIYLGEGTDFSECPIYWRLLLAPDDRFQGPAVIEQMDSTTLILPGQEVYVDEHLSLIIDVNPKPAASG